MASENGAYRGLLTDWGGVLTTDLFASFRAFSEREGLPSDAISHAFRDDRELRELMLGLEVGSVTQETFELRLAERLGVDPTNLIDRLFGGSQPDEQMRDAVRARPHRRDPDGARIQLLGDEALPARAPRRAVRRGRDLGRGRHPQARARDLHDRRRADRARAARVRVHRRSGRESGAGRRARHGDDSPPRRGGHRFPSSSDCWAWSSGSGGRRGDTTPAAPFTGSELLQLDLLGARQVNRVVAGAVERTLLARRLRERAGAAGDGHRTGPGLTLEAGRRQRPRTFLG